ncbi:hypothetical protein R1sor_019550 [Riccia sorocarpa]|uniref:Uncharacterized protein n=1 Tax=Riccia sorocarpa TaxID=122646 RepID=A0ABD3ICU3_9MARC
MDIERFTRCDSGNGQKDRLLAEDGRSGPVDLLQEALKLIQDPYHIVTFFLIQFIIVVPSTVVLLLAQWFEYEIVHKLVLQPPAPPAPWPDMWVVFLIFVLLSVSSLVLTVNHVAATFYTAGSMYSGQNVTFKQVIQALPCLSKKLIITALWGHAFFIIESLFFFVFFNGLTSIMPVPVPVLCVVTSLAAGLTFFFTNSVLQLAYGVTVFDGDDCKGVAAIMKGMCLARNQWCTAFGLLLINDLPGILLGTAFTYSMVSVLDVFSKCLIGGFLVLFASVFRNLSSVTYILFYFSIKATRGEKINFDAIADHTQFETRYDRWVGCLFQLMAAFPTLSCEWG